MNKVAGNIQFSPGRSFVLNRAEVFDIVPYLKDVNHYFGHFIHQFSFESETESQYARLVLDPNIKRILGIDQSPLDEIYSHVSANVPSSFGATGRLPTNIYFHPRQTESADYMFQYFLKVVSTKYKSLNGDVVRTTFACSFLILPLIPTAAVLNAPVQCNFVRARPRDRGLWQERRGRTVDTRPRGSARRILQHRNFAYAGHPFRVKTKLCSFRHLVRASLPFCIH